MPRIEPGRFFPAGSSLRAKGLLLAGLASLVVAALWFAVFSPLVTGSLGHLQNELADKIGGASSDHTALISSTVSSAADKLKSQMAWVSVVLGGVLAAASFLAVGFLFARKSAHAETGLQATAPNRDPDGQYDPDNREALLHSVLESASEGIIAFRSLRADEGDISDFFMVLANIAAGMMLRWEPKEKMGKRFEEIFPGSLSEALFDRCVSVVDSQAGESLEAFYENDEIRSWFHISIEPWSDGFVVMLEEISQRKRVEQELQANIEEMERFNRAMIGREKRVLEMKSEVNLLRARLNLPPAYKVDSMNDEV